MDLDPKLFTPFQTTVSDRFGVLPNFFCTAAAAPGLVDELWSFARSAYLDSALPSLFKERLFVQLSRFCEIRYCIVRHVGFLVGLGRPAGDPDAAPESVDDVIALLARPIPEAAQLAAVLDRLRVADHSSALPEPGTPAEGDLFDALTVIFVEPARSERAREAVRAAVGDRMFEMLAAYLAFVRTAHFWTETHPELAYEPDVLALMEERPDLQDMLLSPADAERVRAGGDLRRVLAELHQTEAALRTSEARYRAFVNASADVVYRMSPDWSEMRELDGRGFIADTTAPREDWRDRYILPEDRATVQAAIDAAIAARGMFALEHRVIRPDGSTGWTSSRAIPILDRSGEIVEWLGTASDVTDQRHAARELRESEARNRLLVESWAQTIWETDAVGVVVTDSPSWRAYTGQSLAEWLGYGWLDAIHPDDRAYAERQWEEAIAARQLLDAEFRLRSVDGGWRWTNVRAAPVFDEAGDIEKWAGINIDIDERKRAEAALRESEGRLRALFESIDEGFSEIRVILDDEGHVVDWLHLVLNGNFSRVTGIPDITGRLASEVFPNLEGEWFRRVDLAYRTGEPQRFETELADLGRWFDNYITRSGGEDDQRVFGIIGDITERKLAERALRESEERQAFLLRLSDGLRAQPDAAAVADFALHTLRNQLGLDRCYIARLNVPEDWAEYLHQVGNERVPPMPAGVRISSFPEGLKVAADRSWVIDDLAAGVRSETDRSNLAAIGHGALVAAFVREGEKGEPLWVLSAVSANPRHWSAGEVTLIEETAERTWTAIERVNADRRIRESEERLRLLVAELQHRVRNILTVVRLTFSRTAESDGDRQELVQHFLGRLDAMARTQVALTRHADRTANLEDLIRSELLSVGVHVDGGGVTLAGPEVELDHKTAEGLAMVLHELATNALKYGALCATGATLDVTWTVDPVESSGSRLVIEWSEQGVPAIAVRPSRRGFGRELIEEALPYRLGAETRLEFRGGGVRCAISIPLGAESGRTMA